MWNIIQCAVKGRSHEKVNMPCQDKTYALFENDVQTIALYLIDISEPTILTPNSYAVFCLREKKTD